MLALCKRNRQPRASRPQEHRQNIARTRKLKRRHQPAKPLRRLRLESRPLVHQKRNEVAKKRSLAQERVRLQRLLRRLPPRPKQRAVVKRRIPQRMHHHRLLNSRLATCSNRKAQRQLVPLPKTEAPLKQLILLHPAEVTVACGLTPTRMCTTGRGRVFTARPRRANT